MKNSPSKAAESTLFAVSAALTLAVSAALFTAPASAETAPPAAGETVSFPFTYDRTDLTTNEGANKVLTRLQSEAAQRCLGTGRTTMEEKRLARTCIDTAMRDAISQLNSKTVAEAYAARNS